MAGASRVRFGGNGRAAALIVAIALAAALLSLWAFWPGILVYDAVRQYAEIAAGHYDDWHPPAMARLWAGLLALGLRGSGAMLALQLAGLWGGTALAGLALARAGAPRAGVALACAPLFPILLDWSITIDKDVQLLAALTAASGILAWFRLGGRTLPWPARLLLALPIAYALLVRANAAFAVVPLLLGWAGWFGVRALAGRAALLLAGLALVVGLSGPINHRLLGAAPSHVERTLPMFDLAGIADYAPLASPPGATPAAWALARQRHCYTPFYWDPFADPARCGALGDTMMGDDEDGHNPILRDWLGAIARHPLAYAEHRLAHLNANWRFLVPAGEPSTAAPSDTQPNDYGLGLRRTAATQALAAIAGGVAASPLGAPVLWLAAALVLAWALSGAPPSPARALAASFAWSAALGTLSFAVVSIASDLRYHLWLFMGTLFAATFATVTPGLPVRRLRIGAALCLPLLIAATLARWWLTALPQ